MNVLSVRNILALVFAAFIVTGCASQGTTEDTPTAQVEDSSGSDATATGMGTDSGLSEAELAEQQRMAEEEARRAEEAALREVRTFYFDFDKSTIKPESRTYLDAHAAFLSANPNQGVVLNGYTDERGTKEYNLALGERRAKAVQDYLRFKGVSLSQMEAVSFGEEFPVDAGHSEAAWAKNRRVVIEYK
ncbi:peptidoglycan-associated lipoprotein [Hahella sp. CCB-MM4]|uniref:peptidoglycan-associated lipoprotein Pal n=1 Tax=Hahella sp. (strain CCB-MM4) TaxID=1926491 RepID=UPI000B9B024A|nr:peptidoglycan-associated lipoprotein Pal [Hahella sp. CCB-MM4]OZG72114.1 peptidoglycan-associated lipoprotein [Hahella sp. CCB-MM4]